MNQAFEIRLFDTTERDGAQSLHKDNQFPVGSKVGIAEKLAQMGIHTIEAGFPATAGDGEEVAEVAQTVGQTEFVVRPKRIADSELVSDNPYGFTPVITGLTVMNPVHIETTWEAVRAAKHPGIHIFAPTAEDHMRVKFPQLTKGQILGKAVESVRQARDIGGAATVVEFSCEAASTSEMGWLEHVVKTMLQEDINVINLPDTLGAASPNVIRKIFTEATKWVVEAGRSRDITISTHNHNDKERAVSNSMEAAHAVVAQALAMEADDIPVFQIEGTAGDDLGERAGNANLPTVIFCLLTEGHEFPVPIILRVDPEEILGTAQHITNLAGLAINTNAAIIGRDVAAHRSGVHAAAVVDGGAGLYVGYDPKWAGHAVSGKLEEGKFQGAKGRANLGGIEDYSSRVVMLTKEVTAKISEFGMDQQDEDVTEKIVVAINTQGKQLDRRLTDSEIESVVAMHSGEQITPTIKFLEMHPESSGDGQDGVRVKFEINDRVVEKWEASPDGPVTAGIEAANELLGIEADVDDLHSFATTSGHHSGAGAKADVIQNGNSVSAYGEGKSLDDASMDAYVNALDLIERINERKARD